MKNKKEKNLKRIFSGNSWAIEVNMPPIFTLDPGDATLFDRWIEKELGWTGWNKKIKK